MATSTPPALVFEEIDDLLYFVRANETQELEQHITELAQKHQCQPKDVLEAATDPETGNTVLHFSSANGHADLLSALLTQLKGGAEIPAGTAFSPLINHGNKEGNTPLHWAAYQGHLPVVKILLGVGADMWAKNAAGHLAMFEAERADRNEVVQHLLEAGGKEVEKAGVEGTAAADEVGDEDEGEEVEFRMAAGSATGQANGAEDVEMDGVKNG
jgi:hypothetical protein